MSRPGLTRERVVTLAADLADRDGLRQVTLSAVARAAGVRTPSLYAHLRGTDDLRAELTSLALRDLAERGDRALAGVSGRAALAALGEVHRRYAREHPGRYEAAALLDVPVTAELRGTGDRLAEQTLAVVRGYGLDGARATHAVRLVAGLVRGWVQLEAGGAFDHRPPPVEASWTAALDGVDALLREWAD